MTDPADSTQPQPLTPEDIEGVRQMLADPRLVYVEAELAHRLLVALDASRAARTADPGGLRLVRSLYDAGHLSVTKRGEPCLCVIHEDARAALASETTAPDLEP